MQEKMQQYRNILSTELAREIKFWLDHSLDTEFGGFFNCLDKDGKPYDSTKHVWLQGRQVWMLSKLYNTTEAYKTKQVLEAARSGMDFLRSHIKVSDASNRCFFSLTREGKPLFLQRKPFSECFYVMALAEFSRATGDKSLFDEALNVFQSILKWAHNPALLGRPVLEGQTKTSSLAVPMILLNLIDEIRGYDQPNLFKLEAEWCVQQVLKHVSKDRKLVFETVGPDGELMLDTFEGRLINPGHAIECGWFLLNYAIKNGLSQDLKNLAIDMIEWSFEFGWDKEHGGLYYFLDSEGYSPIQLEWNMKLWWPHNEALVAFLLAYRETRQIKYFELFEKVLDYQLKHFADPNPPYGWFGYCDRFGNVTQRFKGGPYKGYFHVPRALYLCRNHLDALLQQN